MNLNVDRAVKFTLMQELRLVNLKRVCRMNGIKIGRTKKDCANNIIDHCDRYSYGFEYAGADLVMTIRMTL